MQNGAASHHLNSQAFRGRVPGLEAGGIHFTGAAVLSLLMSAVFSILSCSAHAQTSASSGEWVWMGGSSTIPEALSGQPGVYGTRGVAAADNIPGGRTSAASWVDSSGNFWLFQGYGLDSAGAKGSLNDLWKFDFSARQWIWVSGSSIANTDLNGVYGTLGSASSLNLPGYRHDETIWAASDGKIWLFGGRGVDESGNTGILNDLWEFDPSTAQWIWMGGSRTVPDNGNDTGGNAGVYGTLGTPDAGNIPGSRASATGWVDHQGNLWLFGGWGYDSEGNASILDDLWKFDLSTREWTWMGGSSKIPANPEYSNWIPGVPGTYGASGFLDSENQPGSRSGGIGWVDQNGDLWLYGGNGLDGWGTYGALGDIWKYSPDMRQWGWMGGSGSLPVDAMSLTTGRASGCQAAQYNEAGVPNPWSIPGCGAIQTWTNKDSDLWLFGGGGDGVWSFYPQSLVWAWWSGGNLESWPGVYGVLGSPAVSNIPGSRYKPAAWTDSDGRLWLFAGLGVDASGVQGYLNDLWEYLPAPRPTLPAAIPAFNPPTGQYPTHQQIAIADATPGAVIHYTTDGTPPTPGSAVYRSPIDVVKTSTVLQAIAIADGYSASEVGNARYWLALPLPVFSPPSGGATSSGVYSPPLLVQISDSTAGTTIYFTTDGTTPTTDSSVYTAPISVSTNVILKAFASEDGFDDSLVATAWYTPDPLLPWFTPPTGTYTAPLSVFISSATRGASFYYTTDGTTPTTSSTLYVGPVRIDATETLKAIGVVSGKPASAVAAATYTIVPPVVLVTEIALPDKVSVAIGSTTTISASVIPANATNKALNWASGDSSIATVNSAGVVTGLAKGATLITASSEDGSAIVSNICTVTVGSGFTIAPSTSSGRAVTIRNGGTAYYTLSLTPASGTTFTSQIAFSATELPPGATAEFVPGMVAAGSGSTNVALSVHTSSTSALGYVYRPWIPALCLFLLPLANLRPYRRRIQHYQWRGKSLSGLVILVILATGVTTGIEGCGGGRSAKSYTITVHATSGVDQETTTLELKVT